MLIKKLLEEKSISPRDLYKALNKKGHKDRNKDGGLGSVFKKKSRHALVNAAFHVDDKKEEVTIKDVNKLWDLALIFKQPPKDSKIHDNDNKFAICLALICHFGHPEKNRELIDKALVELKKVISDVGSLKKFHAPLTDVISKKTEMLKASTPKQDTTPAPQPSNVEIKTDRNVEQKAQIDSVKLPDTNSELVSQILVNSSDTRMNEPQNSDVLLDKKEDVIAVPVVAQADSEISLQIPVEPVQIANIEPEKVEPNKVENERVEPAVVLVEADLNIDQPPKQEEKEIAVEVKKNEDYPRDFRHATCHMEALLNKMDKLKTSDLEKTQEAQVRFLLDEMKKLNIYEKEALCRQFKSILQVRNFQDQRFDSIRKDHDKWQIVVRGGKMTLIDDLIKLAKDNGQKPSLNHRFKLDSNNYNHSVDLLSVHTGRFFARFGKPFSQHVFEDIFERDETLPMLQPKL